MKVQKFTFNPFQENTFVLHDESKDCVIVDAGCYDRNEQEMLKQFIEDNGLNPVALISTHSHLDHVFGNEFVKTTFEVPQFIHKEDLQTLSNFERTCNTYGIPAPSIPDTDVSFFDLEKGFEFGNTHLEVRFVPGHAPGHVVFIHHDSKTIINGDCLFMGSIGRTDLPEGNHDLLLTSIRQQMFTLPDDYTVFTGHGPETTIGFEKSNNPFLN